MFQSFEPMRRKQLALGDAVSEVMHAVVRSELDTSFSRPDGRAEMESLIEGHWKQVLPDALITMGRFRAAWACTLAGIHLAGIVAKACEAGRAPLLMSDGRLFGIARDGSGGTEEGLVDVIARGVALPEDAARAVWQCFCTALSRHRTTVPGIEIFSAHFMGCVRLLPAPTAW